MTYLVMTPLLFGSKTIDLSGGVWRKRVLPIGSVEYKGRKIDFTPGYLGDIVEAFRSGCYDQVPFQIADAANTHTNDPERYRGEITDMTVQPDGLWIEIATTPAGNEVLRANPKLGVSARIVEDYARSDGQYYPRAIQHVLGTLDPRIPDLGPWQPVEMSGGPYDATIDLSRCEWPGEPGWEPPAYDFSGGSGSPGGLRELAGTLRQRHPGHIAADHAGDAADALDSGLHNAALRHLRAAYSSLDPQAVHPADSGGDLSQSRGEIVRNILLVQTDRDDQYSGQPDQAGTSPALSNNSYEFADQSAALELASQQAALDLARQQQVIREIEDAKEAGLRRDEDILAAKLKRQARGTYTAGRVLSFSGYSPGGYGCSCGAVGDDGTTVSRFHTAGCEFALSADEQADYRDVCGYIASQPMADSHGHTWTDQFDRPMTLSDHIEALTGVRNTRAGEQYTGLERRELAVPQRITRFGDIDGGEPGEELTEGGRATIAALRAALNLPDHAADREQKRLTALDRWVQRPPQRFRTLGEALDYGSHAAPQPETADFSNGDSDRYQRVGWDDGCNLPGELTGLSYY